MGKRGNILNQNIIIHAKATYTKPEKTITQNILTQIPYFSFIITSFAPQIQLDFAIKIILSPTNQDMCL